LTGRSLEPITEKDSPFRFSWVIWTGAEPPFKSETVVLAIWLMGTVPKVIVLGDATMVPVPAPLTRVPPQPDSVKGKQQDEMISRAVYQPFKRKHRAQ
jgi:hypothetical protein